MLCSCLIARNLLSGLKTCVEVSRYMHDWGASMPHGSIVAPISLMEDNMKADMEYTVSNQCLFLACQFYFVEALVRTRLNYHCLNSWATMMAMSSYWQKYNKGYPIYGVVCELYFNIWKFLRHKGAWLFTTASTHLSRFYRLKLTTW